MRRTRIYTTLFIFLSLWPVFSHGQEFEQSTQGTWRARVVEVVSQEEGVVPGTNTQTTIQTIKAEILEGEKKGEIITIENDYVLLEEGDAFFLNYLVAPNGDALYSVLEPDRRWPLFLLAGIFILIVIIFGRMQGVRSLASLAAGFIIIIYLLLPAILRGISPLLAGIGFSILILLFAMYFTHGFKRETHAAFLGTAITIIIVGILALWSVGITRLSGFSSDEAIFLNLDTQGKLDFAELLIVAIIIGALGILDDIAITQASFVKSLKNNLPSISRKEAYKETMKIGKEHVGALINTLALAYAGASLPLLLLFYGSDMGSFMTINREFFAVEIVRAIVGSIGLILAVPISTFIATMFLIKKAP